ncbi:MAG: DUF2273 domain-containing protein [Bacillota bacterium]|jgi:uncharacterized membrane protein|nr:DUF2273 domain-containing protein [Bacillota bacterium]
MRWFRGLNWQPPPEHSGEVIGAIVGGLLGLFVIIVGFWRALVVAMFIAIGVAVGRYIDVNEELKENIARRFRQPRGR